MKRKKQFRKIQWALRKSHGRKKKKLKTMWDKLLTLAMLVWLKFSNKNDSTEPSRKNEKKKQFKKVIWALRHSYGRKKKKLKTMFEDIVALAKSIRRKQFKSKKNKKKVEKKIQLKKISCSKNSPINYYDNKGYVYTQNSSRNGTLYLRCKHSRGKHCHARAIVKNNEFDDTLLVKGHRHKAERKDLDRAIFSKTLERISRENPFSKPLLCYSHAKAKLKRRISRKHIHMPSYYRTFIHRNQKRYVPVLPKTIEEFVKQIKKSKNSCRYAYDDLGKRFFRGVWRGMSGDNLAFVSERTLKEVKKLKEVTLLMDGTFKALPRRMKFRQLYIINVIISGRCFPLAYILMQRKDYHSYMTVFNNIKYLIPSLNVVQCMSDYEEATRKAIRKQFPKAQLSGCYFHYVQAINKKCKQFGLKKDKKFKVAVNKIAALALLPNECIAAGFESISKHFEKSNRWKRFEAYWKKQWAEANISVFGLKHRTNNLCESLNRTINLLIGGKKPHIWKLIHKLKIVEMLRSDELEQIVAGAIVETERKKEMIRINKKIKKASKRFKENEDIEAFLNAVTFNDELSNIFHANDADYNDKYEDIIRNDYNEVSNFRQNHQRKAAKKRKGTYTDVISKRQRK